MVALNRAHFLIWLQRYEIYFIYANFSKLFFIFPISFLRFPLSFPALLLLLFRFFMDPLRTFYWLFLTPFSGICYSVCLSHRRITQPLPKDYPRITRQKPKSCAFTVYILCIYTLFHHLCSFLNTAGAWDFVHCARIECRHFLLRPFPNTMLVCLFQADFIRIPLCLSPSLHFCRIFAATTPAPSHSRLVVCAPAHPTPAFLRPLVRGDVFSVETVASAWGSGREGAPAAPVSEENTSAKGFRASKHPSVTPPP